MLAIDSRTAYATCRRPARPASIADCCSESALNEARAQGLHRSVLLMMYIMLWFLFGIVSAVAANSRGRSGCGWFITGVLLGPFGLILVLVLPKQNVDAVNVADISAELKKCPFCAEMVRAEAIRCRYCGADISSVVNTATSMTQHDKYIQDLQSTNPNTRETAVSALGRMGGDARDSIQALELLTKDPNSSVRDRARWAIEEIKRRSQ
ncbi:MAG: hypothetical protein C0404_15150 [Verrucomicrobia bacterium]|nr:hypothetical protein [Verrucomicrobiota bacterium]